MSDLPPVLLQEQLHDLSDIPPSYEYEGLILPERLRLDALFGSHDGFVQTPEEMLAEHRRLREFDVVIIEAPGWNDMLLRSMQKITKGDYRARELQLDQYYGSHTTAAQWNTTWVKTLYDVKARPVIIDPPQGHPTIRNRYDGPNTRRQPADFKQAVDTERKAELEYGERNKARENYMLQSFVSQTQSLLTTDRKLRNQQEQGGTLSVAIWGMGITHSGLYSGIQEIARRSGTDLDSSISFYQPPNGSDLQDYHGQIIGRQIRGLEVDDLLVAKHLVLNLIFDKDPDVTQENISSRVGGIVRELDVLGIEELSDLFTELRAA